MTLLKTVGIADSLKRSQLGLGGLALLLITIHLSLVGKTAPTFFLGTSILFWLAIVSRIWEKRHLLQLNSSPIARCLGIGLLSLIALKILPLTEYDPFLRFFPLLSFVGLGLLASGFKELKQYWQEFALLAVLAIPPELITQPIDKVVGVSNLTAKFSSFVLWHVGFDVSYKGKFIFLPEGGVWISPECAGLATLLWLLQLSILFVAVFPLAWHRKIWVPIMAIVTGFTVNGLRIAKLAVLATSNQEAFDYWHSENAQIFSLLDVLLIGGFCFFLIRQEQAEYQELENSDAYEEIQIRKQSLY